MYKLSMASHNKFSCFVSLSVCLFVVLFQGCLARQPVGFQGRRECRFNELKALEPTRRIEYEGGVEEFWDNGAAELECAGVSVSRVTVHRNGLYLPTYFNAPRLIYVQKGRGYFGSVIPGCPETFQTRIFPQGQQHGQEQGQQHGQQGQQHGQQGQQHGQEHSQQGQQQGQQGQEHGQEHGQHGQQHGQVFLDHHQKVEEIREGDFIALREGDAFWSYNEGNTPLVYIALLDVGNDNNQLDKHPRTFTLAGNERQGQQQSQHGQGQQQGQGQQGQQSQQQNWGTNVFSGFTLKILAESFNIDLKTAKKLQNNNDKRGNIVKVQGKLQFAKPPSRIVYQHHLPPSRIVYQHQQQGQGGQQQGQGGQQHGQGGQQHGQGGQQHGQGGQQQGQGGQQQGQGGQQHGQGGQQHGQGGQQQGQGGQQHGQGGQQHGQGGQQHGQGGQQHGGQGNGFEETLCTQRFRENLDYPDRADVYVPNVGRLAISNSQTLPVLRQLKLSALRGVLYRNGIMVPHWILNANTVIFVTGGESRVQVVNDNGQSVFDNVLRQGQLLVVPQNFVITGMALENGVDWVEFRTNDNAITQTLAGRTSVMRGLPEQVIANAYQVPINVAKQIKYNNQDMVLTSGNSWSMGSGGRTDM